MRRAFTLLEVLLAIGLIAALSGGVFAFMWQIISQKTSLTGRALDGQAGDAVLERIESALTGAVAADSAGNAGIVGTATSLHVLTRGIALPLEKGDQAWAAGDLQGMEFTFAGGSLSARRWDGHRNRGSSAGAAETVSDHIAAMVIRYYDGSEWAESFDSKEKDGLPVAIEVSLWFGTPSAETAAAPAPVAEPERKPLPVGAPVDDVDEGRGEQPPARGPSASAERAKPSTPPDRLRVIVIPDGPTTAWKESR